MADTNLKYYKRSEAGLERKDVLPLFEQNNNVTKNSSLASHRERFRSAQMKHDQADVVVLPRHRFSKNPGITRRLDRNKRHDHATLETEVRPKDNRKLTIVKSSFDSKSKTQILEQDDDALKNSNLNVSRSGAIYERAAARRERFRSAQMKHAQSADLVALNRHCFAKGPGMTSLIREDLNETKDNHAILEAAIKSTKKRKPTIIKSWPTKRMRPCDSKNDDQRFLGASFAEAVAFASIRTGTPSIVVSNQGERNRSIEMKFNQSSYSH